MYSNEHFRVAGHVVTLTIHVCNIAYMLSISSNVEENEDIVIFKSMQFRFFTSWTFILQILYSTMSLICDLLIIENSKTKQYSLPRFLTKYRHLVFDALVWPSSWTVPIFFWTVYHFDRSLIFPEYLDAVIPPISNHIIHTMIIAVVSWEVAFTPRREPLSHAINLTILLTYLFVYLCMLIYTYVEQGVWLYPLFARLYGTPYFEMGFILILALFIQIYYTQWRFSQLLHGDIEKADNKKIR